MFDFESYYLDVIKGRRTGAFPSVIKFFLRILSLLYEAVTSMRNWGYNKGWLKQYMPPVPVVVSIGNITAGGTGKTPVTLHLAKSLQDAHQIAILSRGYRSQITKSKNSVPISQGNGPLFSASYAGDEPYLLAENLPKASVYVGKNRVNSSNMAAKAGAELILLDDGMQHRQLARDFELVVVDGRDPFGQGHCLPRGLLREGKTALSRADFIVLNHVSDSSMFHLLTEQLSNYTTAPMAGMQMKCDKIYDLDGNEIESLKGEYVGVFCGIANPQYFLQSVDALGAQVVDKQFYPDHKIGKKRSLVRFAKKCKNLGATKLLCTEKDKVKLEELSEIPLPIVWIKMGMEVVEGEEEWNEFKNKIEQVLPFPGK